MLLREHRGPLAADFRAHYGVNLIDVLRGEVAPLSEVAAWAANLPHGSAVHRAASPSWQHDWQLELSRQIEYGLRALIWVQQGKGKRPEPVEFPWELSERQGSWRGDSLEWDEAAEKLGGDPRLAALMAA